MYKGIVIIFFDSVLLDERHIVAIFFIRSIQKNPIMREKEHIFID